MIERWVRPWLPLALLLAAPSAVNAKPAKVVVELDKPVHRMASGLGASWHAIVGPIDGHAGSAWGGNPPAEDLAGWKVLTDHAVWLGLDFARVELEQRSYQPEPKTFTWDSPDMKALYRILDWAEKNRVDVFLQQMWSNVAWNAIPGVPPLGSAPRDLDEFGKGLARLVQHLVRDKGYSCIKWVCITNEPNGWWKGGPTLTQGLAAARKAMDELGLRVPLSGPDTFDAPRLVPAEVDYDALIGAYDIHTYRAGFNSQGTAAIFAEWAKWAHDRGKPFFLSEIGSMNFGWGKDHPGPGSYDANLANAVLTVRSLNVGVDGVNRWSFTNRGDLDGQWQMVDTWDTAGKKLLGSFTPHANSYAMWGLLSRYTAKGSTVLSSQVTVGGNDVTAVALRSPRGALTLIVVTYATEEAQTTFELNKVGTAVRLHRYRVTTADKDQKNVSLAPGAAFDLSPGATSFSDVIPGRSISVYSTYRLEATSPGVIAEDGSTSGGSSDAGLPVLEKSDAGSPAPTRDAEVAVAADVPASPRPSPPPAEPRPRPDARMVDTVPPPGPAPARGGCTQLPGSSTAWPGLLVSVGLWAGLRRRRRR